MEPPVRIGVIAEAQSIVGASIPQAAFHGYLTSAALAQSAGEVAKTLFVNKSRLSAD